jgi:oxalate decarboxylase/phosphoglucose isomerase-like protein (cupin superfamily)
MGIELHRKSEGERTAGSLIAFHHFGIGWPHGAQQRPAHGAATDTFGPGDVWYFPRGWGHSIQGSGPSECHFILMFDNGAFSEDHTLSISDWLAHTSPAVVSQNLGFGMEWAAKLPKGRRATAPTTVQGVLC